MLAHENNLIGLLQERCKTSTDRVAYRFIEDDHSADAELTYFDLHNRAMQIATALRKCCNKGDRALMMYHSSREFIPAFFGCLYAGVIAVPAYPPKKNHNALRLRSVLEDAGVSILLTTSAVCRQVNSIGVYADMLGSYHWLNTDELVDDNEILVSPNAEEIDGDEVMFLQYTSGSTGKPKGVMVTHNNILANLRMLKGALRVNEDSIYVSWLPYFHDMGLIGVILEAMYAGVPAILMSPAFFLQKPVRWLQAISKYGGTISGAPNFAYDLCVDKIRDEDVEGIDLSTLKVAFNGSEPVSAKTIERFCNRFEKFGFKRNVFMPSFGLAEGTLFVSGNLHANGPSILAIDQQALLKGKAKPVDSPGVAHVDIVSCGCTWHGHEVAIVDPVTKGRCEDGRVGELWFKGASVAKGYWNKPEVNAEMFQAYIDGTDDGPYLRTGDLAFQFENEFYITGRLKDILIIRGSNYYPQDLEAAVWESHPALVPNSTCVFSVDTDSETQLVAVQEVQRTAVRNLQKEQVFEAIVSAIASEFQLHVHDILLLPPGNILKTSSGKIQRQANKLAYLNAEFKPIAQWKLFAGANGQEYEGIRNTTINTQPELANWIRRRVAELVGLMPDHIRIDKDFNSYGLDSVGAVQLSGALQNYLGGEVPPNTIYDYPTISQLATYLAAQNKAAGKYGTTVEADDDRDVAIIGMSGRFPGANNIEVFEQLLFDGKNAITTPDIDAPTEGDPRKVTYRSGYIPDVDLFDADFFEISPKEAKSVDPQQRLLLELCYTAMQNAGYAPQKLRGTNIGVFVGVSNFDYAQLTLQHAQHKSAYFGTGVALSIAANRVSYFFDFKGPSLCVDTACSSSLVAVHQAIRSIRAGESMMALAGGVNLILSDTVNEYLDAGKLLAHDGHCKTFDENADGYVRGEGAGVLLLKSKKKAIEDNDTILAVIKGSAIVQDGHSNGLLAPNGVSQQQVILHALSDAGVAPNSVQYAEAHGTGTALGDPIEVAALSKVYSQGRDAAQPLIAGAVKANIGHLESAAGIAGLIKTVICLRRRQAPLQVHFKKHNPNISWDTLCVKIPTAITDIGTAGQVLRAGVSSFGFGGTNAHAILEEYIAEAREHVTTDVHALPLNLILLSAKNAEALEAQAASLQVFLSQTAGLNLNDLAYSLAISRDHFLHRMVIKCSSVQELEGALTKNNQSSEVHPLVIRTGPRTGGEKKAFLYTGGGAQYQGMADIMYASQLVFRDVLDQCIVLANQWMEVDLKEVLFAKPGSAEEVLLHRIDYMQPALFAYEYAMSMLWMSWGIVPNVLIGHSLGEIVAACVAGVFSLEDGIKLICSRGRLMQSLPEGGVMISLQATEADVKKIIADTHAVSIAVLNGSDQTVISGERMVAEKIKKIFDDRGVKTKKLQVSHASHSVLMEPIMVQYGNVLSTIRFNKPNHTLISNVTGQQADASICTVQYWLDHLRNTVRFSSGIKQLEESGVNTLIEVGPHPVLLSIARECFEVSDSVEWLPSGRSTDQVAIYDSLARFYASGGDVDWHAFYKGRGGNMITLPTYPFQKVSYWIETMHDVSKYSGYNTNSILGRHVEIAGGTEVFESDLSGPNFAYLTDHNILGRTLVPASAYCGMVQAYIAEREHELWAIEDIFFESPMTVDEKWGCRIQLHVEREQASSRSFTLYGYKNKGTETVWEKLGHGTIAPNKKEDTRRRQFDDTRRRYTKLRSITTFYEDFAMKGLEYGAYFRTVTELFSNHTGVLGKVVLPQDIANDDMAGSGIHPALLDGCLQLVSACLDNVPNAYLPFSVEGYWVLANSGGTLWAEVNLFESNTSDIISASITLWDEQGKCVGEIEKLTVKKVDASLLFQDQVRKDYQYHLEWKTVRAGTWKPGTGLEGRWLVIASDHSKEGVSAFCNVLEQNGVDVIRTQALTADMLSTDVSRVVCFWDRAHTQDIGMQAEANALNGLAQLQKLIARSGDATFKVPGGYWWVTEGANRFAPHADADPSAGPLWGLGRVFIREHAGIPFKLLDLHYSILTSDTAAALVDVISSDIGENELALDGKHLYALRLVQGLYAKEATEAVKQLRFSEGAGFDGLTFTMAGRVPPDVNEVEIKVNNAGLNFRDVFRLLGLIEKDKGQLGGECSGVVVAVGRGVSRFRVGDRVMALAEGSFANYVTTDHRLVALIPDNMTFEEAATVPIAFLTAWYGLKHIADVQAGERILIHSAAGGVGMAAIQIVNYLGGKIFATASRPKWESVLTLNVPHIYDSRTLDFYEQILNDTEGAGVDVVLNSFTEKFVDKSLSLLSKGGRFLEIGKRDIRETSVVEKTHPGIMYCAYDLIYLMQHEQELISKMFAAILPLFVNNTLRPLPYSAFAIENAQEAFQFMAKAKHTGKIILTIQQQDEQKQRPVRLPEACTVLITGGFGGLGLEVANYLVKKYKVRSLLLLGRSAPSEDAVRTIKQIEEEGTIVVTKCVDVANRQALAEVIDAVPPEYPLKGVLHLAGLLDDALIPEQDEARFMRVMAPKIEGAWNLHELTKEYELELFVLFSSAASLIGSVAQSNYASANAFLDSLATFRCKAGLPACNINWGPWAASGLVYRLGDEHKQWIKKQGIGLLSNEEGVALLDDILDKGVTQPVLLPILKKQFAANQGALPRSCSWLFSDILGVEKETNNKVDSEVWIAQLALLNAKQREQTIVEKLQQEIARVLSVPDPRKIHLDKSLQEFGMDSLMAVELRNRLSALAGKKLPVTILFDYPNVLALSSYIDKQLFQNVGILEKKIKKKSAEEWQGEVYRQLMAELQRNGMSEERNHIEIAAIMDELEMMMEKARLNADDAERIEVDNMSLEKLEEEFEKEMRDL